MEKTLSIIFFVLTFNAINALAQTAEDSLKAIISQHRGDTIEVRALIALAGLQTRFDSAMMYAGEGLEKAKELNDKEGEADCYFELAKVNGDEGYISPTIQYSLNALTLYEDLRDNAGIVGAHLILQANYREAADFRNSLIHAKVGAQIAAANNVVDKKGAFPGHRLAPLFLAEIGQTFLLLEQLDSALIYTEKSIAQNELFNGAVWNFPVYVLATIQNLKGQYQPALKNYRLSLSLAVQNKLPWDTLQIQSGMSTLFLRIGRPDSVIYYAHPIAHNWRAGREIKTLFEAVGNLAQAYKIKNDKDSTIKYLELGQTLKDSIFSREKVREIQNISFNERLKRQEIAVAQDKYKSKIQLYVLVAGLFVMVLFALILWRTNIQKRERLKSNLRVEQMEREKERIQLEKAKEIDKAKSAFFANISHEFRTPLTLIKGPVQNLMEEFSDRPSVKKQLKLIQHNADLLLRLINQLLDLAKLEAGTVKVNTIKSDLNYFLTVTIDSFSSNAKQKEIEFNFKLPGIRYDISFDKDKVETIVTNLVGNAVKFTPAKGRVDIDARVDIADSTSAGQLVVTISDTGIGIPAEDQTKIFERFYQLNEGGAHKEVGSGIGLALVKELTELLGGSLKVKSEPGKGSEFCVTLPVQILSVASEVEIPVPLNVSDSHIEIEVDNDKVAKNGRAKLLVVEDNAELRRFIISTLRSEYSFFEAADGKAAFVIALQETPDLIISDVMMPEMDGVTMTAKLKKDIRTSHIPVILLTAKATEEAKITGLNTGADDYLVKPFNNEELVLKVRNMIASRNRVREKVRLEFMRLGPTVEAISADEKLLLKVKEAILKRLSDEQLSVDSLAGEIGLSRAHFYRKITALTGLPVNELIQSFRLERASQLLAQRWGSVSQVAYEVGFSNPSYFSKCFKEHYGVLPSEYGKKHKLNPHSL
jgi:signal transduction histidine kinase/CheY-like chemotaxis protein/AraC-like DNA-binding protein